MSGNFTQTPNLGLFKPTYAADAGYWGTHLNANADKLDTVVGNPPIVSVKTYGAKGDGATNDTAAVQAAFNAAASGGEVYFPPGTYVLAGTITQTFTGNAVVRGAGAAASVLSCASNGLALTFGSNMLVEVSGLSIISTAPSTANTGLAITSADQSTTATLTDLFVKGNAARTTSWQTGISLINVGLPYLQNITVYMPDGTPSPGPTGVYYSGSTNVYATGFRMVNSFIQGGLYGLQVGNWVQGVYLVGVDIIGNGYGVYWQVSAGANEWLAITNCHFNCEYGGVYTAGVAWTSVFNSLFLHLGAFNTQWFGISINGGHNIVISGNQIYGSQAGPVERAIIVNNGQSLPTTISGNAIGNILTLGILIEGNTANASVVGNSITNSGAGILDSSGNSSNQIVGNSFNGQPDIDFQNNVLNSFGGLAVSSAAGLLSGNNWATQGGYIGWNYAGAGMTNFINSRGTGPGGFSFYNTASSSSATPSLMMSLQPNASGVNLSLPLLINAANDAAAASAGVPVGTLYRNGSIVMQRVA